jgi:hypothetical protein
LTATDFIKKRRLSDPGVDGRTKRTGGDERRMNTTSDLRPNENTVQRRMSGKLLSTAHGSAAQPAQHISSDGGGALLASSNTAAVVPRRKSGLAIEIDVLLDA